MSETVIEVERVDASKEPAFNWKNWWRVLLSHETRDGSFEPGDLVEGATTHQTRMAAEAYAAYLASVATLPGTHEYMGAYPEGVRP